MGASGRLVKVCQGCQPRVAAARRRWKQKNQEHIREYRRKYRRTPEVKERRRERARKRRAADPEAARNYQNERNRKFLEDNPLLVELVPGAMHCCYRCRKDKPVEEFVGLLKPFVRGCLECREGDSRRRKSWNQRNVERVRRRRREYNARPDVIARRREYYRRPEQILKKRRRSLERHEQQRMYRRNIEQFTLFRTVPGRKRKRT